MPDPHTLNSKNVLHIGSFLLLKQDAILRFLYFPCFPAAMRIHIMKYNTCIYGDIHAVYTSIYDLILKVFSKLSLSSSESHVKAE